MQQATIEYREEYTEPPPRDIARITFKAKTGHPTTNPISVMPSDHPCGGVVIHAPDGYHIATEVIAKDIVRILSEPD